jgi:hypothetical protein
VTGTIVTGTICTPLSVPLPTPTRALGLRQPMAPYGSERTTSYLSTPATVSPVAHALSLRSWSAAPSLWSMASSLSQGVTASTLPLRRSAPTASRLEGAARDAT